MYAELTLKKEKHILKPPVRVRFYASSCADHRVHVILQIIEISCFLYSRVPNYQQKELYIIQDGMNSSKQL